MPIWAQVRDQVWPTLTLVVPMSAPAAAVEQHYNEFRRRPDLRDWHSPAVTPSPRRLGVFRFVAEHCEFEGVRFVPGAFKPQSSWRELMDLWNQRLTKDHKWRYEDVRNFRRDFSEAKKALFHHI